MRLAAALGGRSEPLTQWIEDQERGFQTKLTNLAPGVSARSPGVLPALVLVFVASGVAAAALARASWILCEWKRRLELRGMRSTCAGNASRATSSLPGPRRPVQAYAMNSRQLALFVVLGLLAAGRAMAQGAPSAPVVTEQHSGTTARLQAVSAVDERVVWVSGVRATWARTLDGGATWVADSMRGPDSWLEFRDVHAASADRAWLLAAGPGDSSRIYHTEDGGRHWTLQFQNRDTSAFYDGIDFWDERRGIVVGDAVRGHMVVMTTNDGGTTWAPIPAEGMPPSLPGEGAPAASGTCIVTRHGGRAWISTEAEPGGRVYSSLDYGRTWRVAKTPIVRGKDSGVASVAMRDDARGFALGGRLLEPRDTSVAVAVTADGGRTWVAAARPPFTGPVYGSALLRGQQEALLVAGPGGLALARLSSGPPAWSLLSSDDVWAVDARGGLAWAVGPHGRIIRIDLRHQP